MALGELGRNPLAPRSTAEGACALRAAGALERDPMVRCADGLAAGFLGGWNVTALAKHRATRGLLVRASGRWRPGAYGHELLRTRFVDEVVLAEVDAGLDELILLGAGLDSRPYRLAERLRGVRVVEVDHPASQASKRARVRRLLGHEPEHVTYLAVDFTQDDLDAALAASGHDRSARTLVVWSGVSFYLPAAAATGVLSWVGGHGDPRASIVFDALWAEAIDGSGDYYGAVELREAVAKRGEPLRWGIPEGRVRETLSPCGLEAVRTLAGEEGRDAFLRRSDGSLHARPYGFGVLVHARAGYAAR